MDDEWTPAVDDASGIAFVQMRASTGGVRLIIDRYVVMWVVHAEQAGVRKLFHFGERRTLRGDALYLFQPGDLIDGQVPGDPILQRMVMVPVAWLESWKGPRPWHPPQGRVAELVDARAVAAMRALGPPDGRPDYAECVRDALEAVFCAVARSPATRHAAVSRAVRRARARLLDSWRKPPPLDALSAEVGMSKYHLLRSFRDAYGASPSVYARLLRAAHARRLLERGEAISAAADRAGFADQSHLTRVFRDVYLETPGEM